MRIKVTLTLICLFSITPSLSFAFCYEEAAQRYGINPVLLQAISRTESNFDPSAVTTNLNGTKDIGLMQINSFWVKSLNLDYNLLLSDPCYNLKTGANILKKCIDRYGYTWEAIGCYNATSKHKRVKYSWKIFNSLKAEDLKLRRKEQKSGANSKLNSSPVTPSSLREAGQARHPSPNSNSSFFFSVRDKTHAEMEGK